LKTVRYLRGTLIGLPDRLAADGQHYPFLNWRSKLKSVLLNEQGRFSYTLDENLTAQFGEGVKLRPTRYEVWDGSTIREQNYPTIEVDQD